MITFKQFLKETLSPNDMDGQFTVGDVKFDNRDGLGATPDNASIIYKGVVVMMTPIKFRALALDADRTKDAGNIEKLMRDGKAIGTPTLYCDFPGDIENPGEIKVMSHEGRARADAFKSINGNILMPVQLHFYGGVRARQLSPEFIKNIQSNGILPERGVSGSTRTIIPDGPYYWNGQTVSV